MIKLSATLAQGKIGEIVIGLGTNSLGNDHADPSYRKMAQIVRDSGTSCVWVGPPRMNPAQSKGFPPGAVAEIDRHINPFYDSLAFALGVHCKLIDSRDATSPGTPGNQTVDGVHRTSAAGQYWVEKISGHLNVSGVGPSAPAAVAD